jgi:uncharacterized protein (DUF2147 family)
MTRLLALWAVCGALLPLPCLAQAADAAHGLWLSAQKDGVVQLQPCAEEPSALCGTVVWDKDASVEPPRPGDCGVRILKLKRYEEGAWRDGWIHDPREKKNYKGLLRAEGGAMRMRAYIGVQVLGKSEDFTRVDRVPPGCPLPR